MGRTHRTGLISLAKAAALEAQIVTPFTSMVVTTTRLSPSALPAALNCSASAGFVLRHVICHLPPSTVALHGGHGAHVLAFFLFDGCACTRGRGLQQHHSHKHQRHAGESNALRHPASRGSDGRGQGGRIRVPKSPKVFRRRALECCRRAPCSVLDAHSPISSPVLAKS